MRMNIEYVTQKCVPVTDYLSRLISPNSAQEDESLTLQITDLGVEPVNIDWDNIRRFMMNDPLLVRLARVIQHRWPEYTKELEDVISLFHVGSCYILSMESSLYSIGLWFQ